MPAGWASYCDRVILTSVEVLCELCGEMVEPISEPDPSVDPDDPPIYAMLCPKCGFMFRTYSDAAPATTLPADGGVIAAIAAALAVAPPMIHCPGGGPTEETSPGRSGDGSAE